MRFRNISGQLPDIPEEIKKERFIDGLPIDVRKWVVFAEPITLNHAFECAKRAESVSFSEKPIVYKTSSTSSAAVTREKTEAKMNESLNMDHLAEELSKLVIKKIEANHRPVSHYTAEITCYNCQEKGHKAMYCPRPNVRRDSYLKDSGLETGERQKPKKPPQA